MAKRLVEWGGALLVLAGALLVLFHRAMLGEVLFWGLPALQFYPWREYAFDLIRAGQLPLWNPYNGAGAPLFANYQSALLYPFNWPGLVLPLAPVMTWTAIAHLFIAGWGLWMYSGRLGAPPLGRGLGALAFGLTGYLIARLGTFPMVAAAAWLPWLLWAAHGLLDQGRGRDGAWLALFTALLLLAGHAQTAWYSLLLVALYAAWWVLFRQPSQVKRLLPVALMITLGAGMAAVQLLATAELLGMSQRSGGVDADFAMNFSYGPARALNLIFPNVFGNPGDGTYLEQGFFFEYAVYVGLIPLISALAALIGWRRSRRAAARPSAYAVVPFWTLVVAIGFVLALGRYTPVFPFLYEHVPTFDLFQAPVRWHLWTVFGLSVLAAIGVHNWGRGYRLMRWTRRALAACLALVLVGLVARNFVAPNRLSAHLVLQSLIAAGVLGALACWLTLRQPAPGRPGYRLWSFAVLLVVAADLALAGLGLNPTVPASFYDRDPGTVGPVARGYWPRQTEDRLKFGLYFRVADYRVALNQWRNVRRSLLPNLNLLDRFPLLNNFDPLQIDSMYAYVELAESAGLPAPMMQAAGVGQILPAGRVRLSSAPGGTPRAWLVESVCWHPTSSALNEALLDSDWDPFRQAHILGDAGCPAPPPAAPRDTVLFGDMGNRLEIVTRASGDRWLIVADADYPGWTATVDGEPVPIYRANLAFRAVQVPPGEHTIVFRYQPAWLWPGMTLSLFSLVITTLLFLRKSLPFARADLG